MGGLPKRKISRSRQGKRRGPKKLKALSLVNCPNCGRKVRPHQVCPSCGYYGGREVVVKKEKKDKAKSKS